MFEQLVFSLQLSAILSGGGLGTVSSGLQRSVQFSGGGALPPGRAYPLRFVKRAEINIVQIEFWFQLQGNLMEGLVSPDVN